MKPVAGAVTTAHGRERTSSANRLDLPVLVLASIGLLVSVTTAFLRIAPNRLLSGEPSSPYAIPLAIAWLVALGAGVLRLPHRRLIVSVIAWLMLAGLPILAGTAATQLMAHAAPNVRIQFGAGFWLMWLAAALLLLDRVRAAPRLAQTTAWFTALVVLTAVAITGGFDRLALVREFHAQRGPFVDALLTHLILAASTLVLALLIGAPLGWWAWRAHRGGGVVVGVLAFGQTVPSIALFALLIGPLAWLAQAWPALAALGFGGTGAAPAVIALVLYALLPIVRYTIAGLDAVPADTREAALGLGMTRGQVLARIQLPLGWPLLLAGLRIVAVQTIGLAAVAALIGAGGLGRFVFLGLGQGATDMVLLGTLAIIALALVVDFLFQGLLALTDTPA